MAVNSEGRNFALQISPRIGDEQLPDNSGLIEMSVMWVKQCYKIHKHHLPVISIFIGGNKM